MSDAAIRLESVCKSYRTDSERANIRAAFPGRLGRRIRREGHWALRDVSFEAAPSEILGIIGENGAGKSTLLKLVARVVAPSLGRVVTRGRIASLIELGVGFHPDLSGAENVRFSAAMLGMSRRELARHYDSIVEFAGVERFMEMPVKRYSSGMLARLGFAVASHLEADIVLVDEVMAVGDADFQRRGYERMQELRREGATLLFVTHNLWLVPEVCQRALRMESGSIVDQGSPAEVVDRYQAAASLATAKAGRSDAGRVAIHRFRLSRSSMSPGDPIGISVRIEVRAPLKNAVVNIVFATPGGLHVAGADIPGTSEALRTPGVWDLSGTLAELPLAAGAIRVFATVNEAGDGMAFTHAQAATGLMVTGSEDSPRQYGVIHIDAEWVVRPAMPAAPADASE